MRLHTSLTGIVTVLVFLSGFTFAETKKELPKKESKWTNEGMQVVVSDFVLDYRKGGVTKHATDFWPEEKTATVAVLKGKVTTTFLTDEAGKKYTENATALANLKITGLTVATGLLWPQKLATILLGGMGYGLSKKASEGIPQFRKGDVIVTEYSAIFSDEKKETEITYRVSATGERDGANKRLYTFERKETKDGVALAFYEN